LSAVFVPAPLCGALFLGRCWGAGEYLRSDLQRSNPIAARPCGNRLNFTLPYHAIAADGASGDGSGNGTRLRARPNGLAPVSRRPELSCLPLLRALLYEGTRRCGVAKPSPANRAGPACTTAAVKVLTTGRTAAPMSRRRPRRSDRSVPAPGRRQLHPWSRIKSRCENEASVSVSR
jgi:hypothetical protein